MRRSDSKLSGRMDTSGLMPTELSAAAGAELTGGPGGDGPVARSQWYLFRRRFFRHRVAVASIVVLAVLGAWILASAVVAIIRGR